ncbi:MAG: hypothetical protein J6N21_05200, partial [Butyrivibrio sp.]|nr:hypothetical protein [Butyrivibrio sp.]
ILSIIAFVIVEICYKENKTKFFLVMNAGIVIYTIVLGVLYVEILAHINFQNGEYLTGFEQYIQMPVVMVLTFWGCFINGFFEKEMSS